MTVAATCAKLGAIENAGGACGNMPDPPADPTTLYEKVWANASVYLSFPISASPSLCSFPRDRAPAIPPDEGGELMGDVPWPPLPSIEKCIHDEDDQESMRLTCIVLFETFCPMCVEAGFLPFGPLDGMSDLVEATVGASGGEHAWIAWESGNHPELDDLMQSEIKRIQTAMFHLIMDGWIELVQISGWPCLRPMGGWEDIAGYFDEGDYPDRMAAIQAEHKSARYAEYLASPEWKQRRRLKLAEVGHRCQLCNASKHLHVHHRTYERRGNEAMNDLIVLCRHCHAKFHDKLGGAS